jgi:hypothetical protein
MGREPTAAEITIGAAVASAVEADVVLRARRAC